MRVLQAQAEIRKDLASLFYDFLVQFFLIFRCFSQGLLCADFSRLAAGDTLFFWHNFIISSCAVFSDELSNNVQHQCNLKYYSTCLQVKEVLKL